jgi:hypothetical protein
LYRFFLQAPNNQNHYYQGTPDAPGGYSLEAVAFDVYIGTVPGLVSLYQFYIGADIDHVMTTNLGEAGGHPKIHIGYCSQNSGPLGSKPLHRYFSPSHKDHFVTINPGGENLSGYVYEGIVCYVP